LASPPKLIGLRRGTRGLVFSWEGGREAEFTARELRIECPCALCVSEATGRRILDPDRIPEDLEIRDIQPVGSYAYRILFSDGHDTGIFTLELLRRLADAGGGA